MKAPGKLRFGYFFIIIVVIAASVGLTYFLSNQGILPIGQEGPPGPQGLTGPQGTQGLPGSFSWGTPQSFGPYVLDISTGPGGQNTPSLNPGDRVLYNFSVSGSDVWYEVRDPYNNKIFTWGISKASSGQGAFIAAASGYYLLAFSTGEIVTPSVITINYTVYPVASR